jgi:hypothetical protein
MTIHVVAGPRSSTGLTAASNAGLRARVGAVLALEQVRYDADSLFGWADCDPLAQDQAVQRPAEEFYDEDERR